MKGWKVSRIIFFDAETTGIDPEHELLLEAAVIVTTKNLHELARECVVIRHDLKKIREVIYRKGRDKESSDFVWDMHTNNGLLKECQDPNAVSLEEADEILNHLVGCAVAETESDMFPLGGCSTWLDKSMIRLYLPTLHERIHRRVVDASSYKVALVNWGGVDPQRFKRPASSAHRAMPDVEDAVKLARVMKLRLQRADKLARAQERELANVR